MEDITQKHHGRTYSFLDLMGFLHDLDNLLDREVEVTAIGGTALELLGLKEETKDIDFFIGGIDYESFSKILDRLSHKYFLADIDFWEDGRFMLHKDGTIIERKFPSNYKKEILVCLKNIKLNTLKPLDLIITKIDRCSENDIDDIKKVIVSYDIKKEELEDRFSQHIKHYEGSKERYISNFKYVLDRLIQK